MKLQYEVRDGKCPEGQCRKEFDKRPGEQNVQSLSLDWSGRCRHAAFPCTVTMSSTVSTAQRTFVQKSLSDAHQMILTVYLNEQ